MTGYVEEPQTCRINVTFIVNGSTDIDAILERPFDRVSLAHGVPISSGGRETVRASYTWLKGR